MAVSALALGIIIATTATPTLPVAMDGPAQALIGMWSLDGADGCVDGDVLNLYPTGAFAATNGGSNPIEAVGTWQLSGDVITLTFNDLDHFEEPAGMIITVTANESNHIAGSAEIFGERNEITLDRCVSQG